MTFRSASEFIRVVYSTGHPERPIHFSWLNQYLWPEGHFERMGVWVGVPNNSQIATYGVDWVGPQIHNVPVAFAAGIVASTC